VPQGVRVQVPPLASRWRVRAYRGSFVRPTVEAGSIDGQNLRRFISGWGVAVNAESGGEESLVQDVDAIEIAREQLSKAIRLLTEEPIRARDELVHEVRKRVKKIRALLKLARGTVSLKEIRKVDRRLRDASRPLSVARDASALISTLDALADRSVGLVSIEALNRARALLVARQDEIVGEVLDDDRTFARTSKALRSVRRKVGEWGSSEDRSDTLSALKRTYKEARDFFEVAADHPSSDSLHDLRKHVKGLGYQLRALDAKSSGPASRIERLAGLLGDELGEIHDLDVLRPVLESQEGSEALLSILDRRRLDLRHGALQRAGVIFQQKPRAFLRSLGESLSPVKTA
jgi:CHAD domain-containing protein